MIRIFAATLVKAQRHRTLSGELNCASSAQTPYTFWLGASLQSKICRNNTPLVNALQEMDLILRKD